MRLRSRIATRFRAVFRREDLDRQVSEDLEFHIESYADDLTRTGMPRQEALRRVWVALGSLAAVRENSRQAWGTRRFDELRGDLRHAMRMLAKSPGFTAIAIGSLALGIGANTVIFTAAQHMLLDRLNVPHPEQLRMFWWTEPKDGVVTEMWGYWDEIASRGDVHVVFVSGVRADAAREPVAGGRVCVQAVRTDDADDSRRGRGRGLGDGLRQLLLDAGDKTAAGARHSGFG
jgi:hypothetical protein